MPSQATAWGICSDVEPTHQIEKVLYATDELTGLIGAAALMRPSKERAGYGAEICQEEIQGLKIRSRLLKGRYNQGCRDARLGA